MKIILSRKFGVYQYLSEVSIGLFDDSAPKVEKLEIVSNINTMKGSLRTTLRLIDDSVSNAVSRELLECFTSRTKKIFYHIFIISTGAVKHLQKIQTKKGQSKETMANDRAERRVALVEEFMVKVGTEHDYIYGSGSKRTSAKTWERRLTR